MPDIKSGPHPPVKFVFDEPRVISQSPPKIRNWGPWQFPEIQRLPDQRIQIKFHLGNDSAVAYGTPPGGSFSGDNGNTWTTMTPAPEQFRAKIFQLANGDLLQPVQPASVPLNSIHHRLPAEIGRLKHSYIDDDYIFYLADELPPELSGWRFRRLPAGSAVWREEQVTVNFPGEVRYTTEGVLPLPWFHRIRLVPDGSLRAIHYARRAINRKIRPALVPIFLRSEDGSTWNFISEIAYQPDSAKDPFWDKRQGFTEPDIAFLADGSVFCLMRTTDGNGIGPVYRSHSTDGEKSWSKPEVFDDLGVLPTLLSLKCGVTVAAYGRPGLFLRATDNLPTLEWQPRVPLVAPLQYQTDTCSYADLLALDDDSFLVVYSDFNYPNAAGIPCKTILVRRVRVAH